MLSASPSEFGRSRSAASNSASFARAMRTAVMDSSASRDWLFMAAAAKMPARRTRPRKERSVSPDRPSGP